MINPCAGDFQIIYTYDSTSADLYANETSLAFVDGVAKIFSLDNNIKKVDVAKGYDELDYYIKNASQNERVLISNNFPSQNLTDLVLHLDSITTKDKYFIVNSFSTIDDPLLNQTHICRLYPIDNEYTAMIYKEIIEGEKASDNYVILTDDTEWSLRLAETIVDNTPSKNFIVTELLPDTVLPEGSLNVICLTVDTTRYELLLEHLIPRKNEVDNLLFGDGGDTLTARTEEELVLLRKWNATVLTPANSLSNIYFLEDMVKLIGYVPTMPITSFVVNLQACSYFKNSVCPVSNYDTSYMFLGLRLNKQMNNNMYLYVGSTFEMVGMFATGIGFIKIVVPEVQ